MATLELDRLNDNWMAEWLQEREVTRLNSDGSNSVRLVQMIQSRRGDNEYFETTDLGEVKRAEGNGDTFVYGGGVTRVGRIREVANEQREMRGYAERYGLEQYSNADMLDLLLIANEEQWKKTRGVSVFGPAVRRQR
ncbi:MAG: hypothetical protein U0990_06375 [Candidatus Nanopelagicales bacterium]|nr:hypothetical protein [Candidatus Nanopelagicales bacterium]